jgi:hypothetical protein
MSRQASRTPSRCPAGYNNSLAGANPASLLANYPDRDPTRLVLHFDDYFKYASTDWTTTQTGGTAAGSAGDGGWLALVASTGGTDSIYQQHIAQSFYPSTTQRLWYEIRVKMDAVSTGTAVFGLIVTDTTPGTNTDGIYFQKAAAGTGSIDFVVNASSTATTTSAIATMVGGTFIRLGFMYDPRANEVAYYVDGLQKGTAVTTNFPSAAGLALTHGVAATSAAARTLTIDYELAAKERWTPNSTPDGR